MKVIKIKDGKFLCGFCNEITITDVNQSKGNGKSATVSSVIKCGKCGRQIPQSNQLK